MNSKNNEPKVSGKVAYIFAIISGFIGTIVFEISVFGELYTETLFPNLEAWSLLRWIIAVVTSFAISAFPGCIIGVVGGCLGLAIEFIVRSIARFVGFIRNKIKLNRERNKQRRAIKEIKRAIKIETKNIAADIERLDSLRKQLTVDDRAVIANYSLCMLLGSLVGKENSFTACLLYWIEKYQILLEIREIETKIGLIAEQYAAIGDDTNAELYFSKIR